MSETKYEVFGIPVTCKDDIEYMPGLFGRLQAVGFCSGEGHPVPTDKPCWCDPYVDKL